MAYNYGTFEYSPPGGGVKPGTGPLKQKGASGYDSDKRSERLRQKNRARKAEQLEQPSSGQDDLALLREIFAPHAGGLSPGGTRQIVRRNMDGSVEDPQAPQGLDWVEKFGPNRESVQQRQQQLDQSLQTTPEMMEKGRSAVEFGKYMQQLQGQNDPNRVENGVAYQNGIPVGANQGVPGWDNTNAPGGVPAGGFPQTNYGGNEGRDFFANLAAEDFAQKMRPEPTYDLAQQLPGGGGGIRQDDQWGNLFNDAALTANNGSMTLGQPQKPNEFVGPPAPQPQQQTPDIFQSLMPSQTVGPMPGIPNPASEGRALPSGIMGPPQPFYGPGSGQVATSPIDEVLRMIFGVNGHANKPTNFSTPPIL